MGQSADAYLFYGIEAGEEMREGNLASLLGIENDPDDPDAWEIVNNGLPPGLKYCDYPIPIIAVEEDIQLNLKDFPN